MALSMEEERILAEIALQLREDDPALAERLVTFQQRPRRRRRRHTVVTIAVSVMLIVSLAGAALLSAIPG